MAIDPTSLDAFTSSGTRSLDGETPEQEFFSLSDTLAAPFRGIEGGIKGLYDFADFVVGDVLPDYDTRFLGTSNTMAGSFVEGMAQFATGFVPGVGILGRVGRVANARKYLGANVANKIARGGKLSHQEARKLAKNTKLRRFGDNLAAGVATDFLMFDAQEERLSNLLYQYPELQNPVTEYLQATEEDGEIEGRFKNALEGIFIEAGVGAILAPFISSVKMIKNRNKKIADGKSPEDAVDEALAEGSEDAIKFDYGKLDDPITGIKGQSATKATPEEMEDFIKGKGLTLDDFIIDETTGRVDFATAGAGGRKASSEDIYNYVTQKGDDSAVLELSKFKVEEETGSLGFIDRIISSVDGGKGTYNESTLNQVKLLKTLRDNFGDTLNQVKVSVGKTGRAYYSPEQSRVQLYDNDKLSTVVHEYVHSLSTDIIYKNFYVRDSKGKAVKGSAYLDELGKLVKTGKNTKGEQVPTSLRELGDLYLTAVDRLGQSALLRQGGKAGAAGSPDKVLGKGVNYGLGDLHEFVTQAFMDPQFQKELASITITKGKKPATVYDKFKELIAKILGFKPQESSMLDEVLSVSNSVFRDNETFRMSGKNPETVSGRYTPIDAYDEISGLEQMSISGSGAKFEKGLGFLMNAATKYKVKINKEFAKQVKELSGTDLYRGVAEGKLSEAFEKAGVDFKKSLQIMDEVDRVFNSTIRKAREAREESVKANVIKFDDKVNLDNYTFKTTAIKGRRGSYTVEVTDPAGKVTTFNRRALSKELAEGSVKALTRKATFEKNKAQIITQVRNGKFLRQAVADANINLSIKEVKEGNGRPDHVEVTFLDASQKEINLRNLPDNIQRETELYLKARGGKVKAVSPQDEVPIGRVVDKDGNPMDPETSDAEAYEDALTEVIRRALKDAGPGGGVEAIKGVIRTISEEKDFITIARALAGEQIDFLTKNSKIPKISADELLNPKQSVERINKELSDAFGVNPHNVEKMVKELEGKGEKLKETFDEMLKDQLAIKMLNNLIAEEVHNLAKEASDLLKRTQKNADPEMLDMYDAKYAQMLQQMELMVSTQRLWGLYGRYPSLAMLQRKFIYGDVKSKRFDSSLNQLQEQSIEAIQAYKNERRGSMGQEKLLQLILTSRTADGIEAGLNKIVKQTMGKRMFDMVREYWINSLLSGISTFEINMIGSAITYGLRTLERAGGAALTGNFELARATLRYAFDAKAIMDSFDLAVRAAKSGEAISIPNSRQFDDAKSSMNAIQSDREGAFGAAINTIGTIVRLPSRGLLTGDELFKAMSYRSYVMTELALKGKAKGLSGKQLGEYVHKGVNAHLTETGRVFNEKNLVMTAKELADKKNLRFSARETFITNYIRKQKKEKRFITEDGVEIGYGNRGALAARAEQGAKINTHTQDSENSIVKGLSNIIVQNPWMTAIVPFVRTPTNILAFGIERSPFGLPMHFTRMMSSKYREGLAKGTPTERAEIQGKMAMSVATTASLIYMLASQDTSKIISGYGPREKNARKAWELDNQPYSIRIGDRIHSYQRMDPMATMLGIIADINEGLEYNEFDEKDMGTIFGVLALAFSNNITNKSYVQGIDNLFKVLKDPINNTEKFVGSIAGGFVPNFVNQTMNVQEDRPLREVRGIMDYMIKRTPGLEGDLPPRYNFLGDVETLESSGGFKGIVDPIYSKDVAKNIVDYELGNLGAGFGKPSTSLRKGFEGLDMRDYYNPETKQQAYARMMQLVGTKKLGGKTLRERLATMFKDQRYQAMPDADPRDPTASSSPKVKAIKRLLSAYNAAAKKQVLEENPELYQRYIDSYKAQ